MIGKSGILKTNFEGAIFLRKEFVITMTGNDRKKMDTKCKETKALLVEIADKIEDSKERQEFWAKIRSFNDVAEVFSE